MSREPSVAKSSSAYLPSVPIVADEIITDDRDLPVVVVENLDDEDANFRENNFTKKVDDDIKSDPHHDYANENLVKGLESVTPLLARAKNSKNEAAAAAAESEKIHTLKYSSGGVLSNKPAQAEQEFDVIFRENFRQNDSTKKEQEVEQKQPPQQHHSPPSSLTSEVRRRSKISKPPAPSLIRTSDLPYIDESDLELDEAIRDAIGIEQEMLVTRIQLDSTTSSSSSANPNSNASTLLVSQRSCSGTDTIHMSEKVIKRDYRDM